MGTLAGRVAIVTGASRGLGRDIAVSLAGAGARVAALARTDNADMSRIPGSLADTVATIREAGGEAVAFHCDVTRESDIADAVRRTIETYGRIDILVNNAGILIPGKTTDLELRHWQLIFKVNVDGPFLFCRAVIPHLIAAGGGHIINISSRGAISPGPGPYPPTDRGDATAYGATKAALERFSQGLAKEVFRDRISVNALSPHLVNWSEGGEYFRSRSGEPDYSGMRMSGAIIGDASVVICEQEPGSYTGNILYDEFVMRNEGELTEEEIATRYPVHP